MPQALPESSLLLLAVGEKRALRRHVTSDTEGPCVKIRFYAPAAPATGQKRFAGRRVP